MPLQYPNPYNPYQEPKTPANWPVIILIALAVVIIIVVGVYFIINSPASSNDNNNNNNNNNNSDKEIAVGEPNPNGYDCTKDIYNCANFTTQSEAQVAFDLCINQGKGDVWNIDNDGDGKVCESLD